MDWCAADGETVHVVPASATRVHTEKVMSHDRLVCTMEKEYFRNARVFCLELSQTP